jgi:hypothetical protein
MSLLECQIDEEGDWRPLSIDDAIGREAMLKIKLTRMRCPVCKGAVKTHRNIKGVQRAHFEHLDEHAGCRHCRTFDGTTRDHPTALFECLSV